MIFSQPRVPVLLVTGDDAVREAVAAALEPHPRLALGEVCASVDQLSRALEAGDAATVVVDLGDAVAEGLDRLDPLAGRFGNVPFVILADTTADDLIFKAMEIGVRYFLQRDSIAAQLPAILERLSIRTAGVEPRPAGAVVTLLSASGGCGATTLSVNLANELSLSSQSQALLVDMDEAYGSVASYLGLDANYGLADVLSRGSQIDSELLRSSSAAYNERLRVLISPVSISPSSPPPVRYEHLPTLLDACKTAFGHTVIDAPRVPRDVAVELCRASTSTVIVLQLTVKDIRYARMLLSSLVERSGADAKIRVVISRYKKRHPMIRLAEARASLGWGELEWVSNDYRSALRGLNLGQPLSEAAPRSSFRSDVRRPAAKVTANGKVKESGHHE